MTSRIARPMSGLLGLLCLSAGMGGVPAHAAPALSTLTLSMMGDACEGVAPHAEVRLNGAVVAAFDVTDSTWTDYGVALARPLAPSDHIDVRFTNDAVASGQDRNLWVRSIQADGTIVQSTDPTTIYDTGDSWYEASDHSRYMPGQVVLPWNGALRFIWPATSQQPVVRLAPTVSPVHPIFSATSFWYADVSGNVPLSPETAASNQQLLRNVAYQGKATVNTTSYAPPVYVVDSSTPRTRVSNWQCNGAPSDPQWLSRNWSAQFNSVPIPVGAVASGGEDQEMVVWSPETDELWEMWRFRNTGSGYQACWGGKLTHASTTDGVFPYPWSTTASGLSMLGGTVRISELQSGHIDHAVAIGIASPRVAPSWPANRSDGTSTAVGAIAEGQRLRLDPSVDVDQLAISPIAKMIARAAQRYGFIVRDNTGGPLVIYAEDSTPYTRAGHPNPYTTMFGPVQHDWMVGFPWDRVQALPVDYGRP